jgi:SAM-dependent methyltransferase
MNDAQREQVVSNAKYLQSVRPIDPDEIYEYVEGEPHPAAVRQVLREEAVTLGLVEQDDGTFVPVADEPLSVDFRGVEAFPQEHSMALEDVLLAEFGAGWPSDTGGDRLRARLREVKEDYLQGEAVEYDRLTALAYAIYHLPDYYAASQYVFADLARDGLLPKDLRVLDVGAGVGGPALGLLDLVPDDALVDYHAVEPSAAADVLPEMLGTVEGNVHTTIHRETAEAFDPEDEYDVVLFANVLSELADPAAVVERYADALASDGTIVAIAPADRNTALGLRQVERAVADDGPLTVYGPPVRLWQGASPESECWSFDVKPDLEVPGFQRRLDEAGAGRGEFVNADVQYASSILRPDGRRKYDLDLDVSHVGRMADMEDHVTNRIDLAAIKLSHDLSRGREDVRPGAEEASGNPLYLVGDGSETVDHYAVLTDRSALNADLRDADYGDLLFFENVLVLWNDDEEAYNLVVDGETVVDAAV